MNRYLLFAVGILLISSCKKDAIEYKSAFKRSYAAWQQFKQSSENSYRYTVTSGSWTGVSSETTIVVQNGQVSRRTYVYRVPTDTPGESVIATEWTEEGDAVGTHAEGADWITLDEIYDRAETDWLKKRAGAETFFEAKNAGLISVCGYVPEGCADDCFNGISIQSVEKL